MQIGKHVTVTKYGILLSADQIEWIAAVPGGLCWGVPMPRSRRAQAGKGPDHMLLWSFDPSTWGALFRVVLRINDTPNTLGKVTTVLARERFNILYMNSTQTGHDHGTLNVVGALHEALDERLVNSINETKHENRVNRTVGWRKLCARFASAMLARAAKLERALVAANRSDADGGFLREIFLQGRRGAVVSDGLVYYLEDFQDSKMRSLAKRKSIEGVRCDWLQYPAFFWLYGHREQAMRFRVESGMLRPTDDTISVYDRFVKGTKLTLPFKTLSSIDTRAHYLRLVLSRTDAAGQLDIDLSYELTDARHPTRTIGVIHRVVGALANQNLNIRGIWNSVEEMSPDEEKGKVHVIAGRTDEKPAYDKEFLNELTNVVEGVGDKHTAIDNVSVRRVGAEKVFVSTKRDWWDGKRKLVTKLLATYGLETISGNIGYVILGSASGVTQRADSLMEQSDAFLQIVPQPEDWDNPELQWLLFELGLAIRQRLPIEICVDCRGAKDIDKWKAAMRIGDGWPLNMFDDRKNDDEIKSSLAPAVMRIVNSIERR